MNLNFSKTTDGLIPAIIQDAKTKNVLMLGYMNKASLDKTQQTGKVTFFSRSKNCLWTKGEKSGNFLKLISLHEDCDNDTLLIRVNPIGPTCHKGTDSCWGEQNETSYGFISKLESIIQKRKEVNPTESYVASLFRSGINKIAQKLGEETIETIIEAKDNNDKLFLNESADLLFHYLILIQAKGFRLDDIISALEARNNVNSYIV
ncbi:MAG: bifunctional phosphoribosyl-AMP cyclohydrolase/phosphoribosyl-ATP diphosphatase HisIE [Flavobacteriaceae bacterium]|nr:bifunctional phosphoribosyl-AMP cyclohydrolase/phosphoribosyl-ATP diphosphatase HisIE [Flavobacteriaceae bacterium]